MIVEHTTKNEPFKKGDFIAKTGLTKYFYLILSSKGITLNRNDYQKLFLLIKDLDC